MGKISNESAKWIGKKMAESIKNIDKPKEENNKKGENEEVIHKDLFRHLFGDIAVDFVERNIKK